MDNKIKIKRDDFNSKVFKRNFANIDEPSNDITLEEIQRIIKGTDYDLYGIKINSKNILNMYNFQKAGFYVVDCLVTYEFDKKTNKLPDIQLTLPFKDDLTDEEVEKLARVAQNVFKIDRFHSDPNINPKLADDYYYQWVKNSFAGFADGAIVPLVNGEVAGFTTYKINNVDGETSTLVLSAVNSDFMGKGVYQNMILKGTLELLKKSNKIRLGTQVDNIPVQRTWQKLGYKLIEVNYVLHFSKTNNEPLL